MQKRALTVSLTAFLIGGLAAFSNAAVRIGRVPLGKTGIVMPMLPGPRLPLTPYIHSGLTLNPALKPISLPQVSILAAGAAVNPVAMPKAAVALVAAENDRSFKPAVVEKQIAGVSKVFGMKDGSAKPDRHESRSAFDGTKRGGTDKTGDLDEDFVEDGDFSGGRPVIFRPARRVTLPTQDLEDELGIRGWD